MKLSAKLRILDATDKSGIKNMLLKSLSMLLSLIYTPLLLSYLGDEKYGLWATLLSIISWINYCDVGIGHGLRNLLTKELAEKKHDDAKHSVSTAYLILTTITTAVWLLLIVLCLTLNWKNVFSSEIDMKVPLIISFSFICINFVLALCNTLLYALHLSERVAFRSVLVQIGNIAGIVLLKQFTSEEHSLIWMSILFGATSLIVYIETSFRLFLKNPYLRPSINFFDKKKIKSISNVGIKFFVIQISCLLLYTVDNLLITHFFGATEVTPFHVVYKAFNMGFSFLSALTVPYWSKTTDALVSNNISWIRKAIKKMYAIYSVFAVAYVGLTILFKPLAALWLGKELTYQPGLIGIMCIYYILFSFVTVNTPFINGTGKINGQLVVSTAMGIINVPLSIFLGVNCGLGVVGVRLATTILMAIGAVYYPINLHIILRKAEKEAKQKRLTSDSD